MPLLLLCRAALRSLCTEGCAKTVQSGVRNMSYVNLYGLQLLYLLCTQVQTGFLTRTVQCMHADGVHLTLILLAYLFLYLHDNGKLAFIGKYYNTCMYVRTCEGIGIYVGCGFKYMYMYKISMCILVGGGEMGVA